MQMKEKKNIVPTVKHGSDIDIMCGGAEAWLVLENWI